MGHLLSDYGWALWLAAPVVATSLASMVTYWRGRSQTPSPARAARDHRRYLDALGRAAAQNTARPPGGERSEQPVP